MKVDPRAVQEEWANQHCSVTLGQCLSLIQTTDQWLSDTDRKRIVGTVLLDFTAAFDLIHHEMLFVLLENEMKLMIDLDDWVTKNNLILNVSKTKCIVFALRRENQLCISSMGSWIKQRTEAKLLGDTIDGQLSWHNHIVKILGKMGKGITIIRRCSSLLTPSASLQVIQALVLFHLVYCPAVWSGAANKELHMLQLVQNRAAYQMHSDLLGWKWKMV